MHLVADSDLPYVAECFETDYDVTRVPGRLLSPSHLQTADVLLVRSITRVDETLLRGTRVRMVGSMTAGTDHLDTNWLARNGIAWCCAPGFNAEPVADYVASVIAHGMHGTTLTRPTAAVIGVGAVGTRVARNLALLGFDCALIDPPRSERDPTFRSASLDALCDCDVISVHTPLTRDGDHPTFHLLTDAILRTLKPGAILINASRGAVIATDALKKHGTRLRLALDVFEQEPLMDATLASIATIATPHLAGHSKDSKARGMRQLAEALHRSGFLKLAPHPIAIATHVIRAAPDDTANTIVMRALPLKRITEALQCTLKQDAAERTRAFDALRLEYGERHEFQNTLIQNSAALQTADQTILRALGFQLSFFALA